MLKFGKKSLYHLERIHPDLKRVLIKALELNLIDISVIESIRPKETQNRYFTEGKSKVQWPNSKHNIENVGELSEAFDAAPYVNGISWNKDHCIFLAGVILSVSRMLGVKIRWGGNWDCDLEPITDQDFQDLVHYERIGGINE